MDQNCPRCGMAPDVWSDPTARGETTYCCGGCANETGCVCANAMTQEEIRDDRASGDFVRSLQKETKHIGPGDYGTDKVTKAPVSDNAPA